MKKNLFKKSMSVFLSVLMLMSCWVFMPATHEHLEAEAVDAGDAVAAYNKSLLDQINTNVDTNMVTTTDNRYKRTDNGKLGDTNSNVTSTHLANSYQNVLNFNNGNIVTSGTGAAATFTGVTNADSVKVWYPDTVLMYDGSKAKMAVLLEVDSNGSSLRGVSCWISGNANGLYVGFDESNPYWRGHSDDDPAVMYCLWIGSTGYYMTSDGTTHSSYKYGCKGWSFHASHIYFTGTMGDTEWVRAINPEWKFRGGSNDTTDWGPVTASGHTIYVMNIQGYKKLVNDIIAKKGSLNGYEGQYTRESLQRFVNACNKITTTLAPKNFVSTTTNNVTSWASQMASAYTEYNNAYNSLVKRNVNVTYENLFSINDWAASESANLQSSTTAEIAVENNNTIKIYKSAAGDEVTTGVSHPNNHSETRYSIPVEGGKEYTVRYDIADTSSVTGIAQSEVFMFWYDVNNKPVTADGSSNAFNSKTSQSKGACSATFTAPANATKAEIRFDNDCPSSGTTLRFTNIAVYPTERATAVELDTWTTRPVTKTVTYGSTLSGKLDVPVRKGYQFNGWYIDNVSVNGTKDSGEEVTDASGNVTNSLTVTDSINLYADWTPLPMDIGYDNLFSLAEWAFNPVKTNKTNGTFDIDVEKGSIKITHDGSADGTDLNTNQGTNFYKAQVKGDTEYVLTWKTEGTGRAQIHVFYATDNDWTFNANADYTQSANWFVNSGDLPYSENMGAHTATFKTLPETNGLVFRFGTCNSGNSVTFSDIRLVEKSVYDAYAKDYAAVRVPFNFGDTTNLALVPTRAGYQFDGWYTADDVKLTSVTGLKASDTVYAKWTKLFTVTFKNWDGAVIKTQEVAPGAAATAPQDPTRAADANYEYDFAGWDKAFTNVQADLVVTATYTSKDHTGISKTYASPANCTSAAKYTQLCTACGYVWSEVFDDANMPALGHTYERENPSSTVVTGTSTGKTDDDVHTIKCNACDATTTVKHNFIEDSNHPATEATCVIAGKVYYKCACLEEKTVEGSTNPNKHVNTKLVGAYPAECGKTGYTGDTYCNDCQKTVATGSEIKALEHKYTNYVYNEGTATCFANGTETATCDLCGVEKDTREAANTKLTHKYTNYVYNEGTAKCEVNGTETAACDHGCNTTDTREAANTALTHDFTGEIKDNNDGTHSFLCKNGCGEYGGTVDCSTWTPDGDNCKCTVCGYTKGHNWGAWSQADTNNGNEAGKHTRSCQDCNAVDSPNCTYDSKNTPATCEDDAYTTYTCTVCGHGYVVIEPNTATGHKFTGAYKYDADADKHQQACANNCGEYGVGTEKDAWEACVWTYANKEAGTHTASCVCGNSEEETCSGGTATCTAQAECQFCGEAYGDFAAHKYDGNTYFDGAEKAKDATCTAQAEYYTYCSACKASSKDTAAEATFKHGELLPHTYTGNTEYLYKATEAECEVNETYYKYCSACKASSKGTDAEATFEKDGTALVHKFDGTITCNNDGTHTILCSNTNASGWTCDETVTANCADSALSFGLEQPTCTEQGYTNYQCGACNYTWKADYTPALGHDYTKKLYADAYLKAAVNCEHAAEYYYACSRCERSAKEITADEVYTGYVSYFSGEVRKHEFQNKADAKYLAEPATCFAAAKYYTSCKYEDCGKSSEEVNGTGNGVKFSSGTALEHDWTEVEDAKYLATEADCANDATYYYECSLCKNSSKDYGDGETWTLENSKSGHSMTHTAAKAADCFGAGNHEYWYCDTCKKYYKDAEGAEAYLGLSETVIKKREHDIEKVAFKEATCEEDGNPAYEYCKYEDCTYTTYPAVLPEGYKATGHNFTGTYTYDEVQLYHSKLCLNGCGKSGLVVDGEQVEYKVEYNEDDVAVIVGGEKCTFTYTAETTDGVHSHVNNCVCGNGTTKTYSDEETFVETVAPTCTTDGYDSYECDDCGETWKKNEVDRLGHTPAEKATSNGDGTHSIYCTVEGCGAKLSTEKCYGGQATCAAKAVCEVCDTAYGETGDHVFAEGSEWVYQDDAKCGVNGTEKNTCTACNQTITREAKGTALKHVMSEYVYELPAGVTFEGFDASALKEPSCCEEGYAISYCTLCKDVYKTKNVSKDSTAHVWETDEDSEDGLKWITAGGNCATGVTMINRCTVCEKTQSKVITESHNWVVNTRVEANCEEDGYIVFKCSACSFTLLFDKNYEGFPVFNDVDYKLTEKLGHTWERDGSTDELVVDKESTCAIAGRGHYICGDCQDKSESVELEKLEHKYVEIAEQKVTCTIDGYKAYVKCVACAYDQHLDAEWLAVEGNYTPATGHADNNNDGKCDGCKKEVVGDETDKCECICHKDSWFSKIIYKILRFFWKLFKIGKSCDCGTVHY